MKTDSIVTGMSRRHCYKNWTYLLRCTDNASGQQQHLLGSCQRRLTIGRGGYTSIKYEQNNELRNRFGNFYLRADIASSTSGKTCTTVLQCKLGWPSQSISTILPSQQRGQRCHPKGKYLEQ